MKILITGASGFVGQRLIYRLLKQGHSVIAITHDKESFSKKCTYPVEVFHWQDRTTLLPESVFSDVSAVVHLAGETVAQRWTSQVKNRIRQSRVDDTTLLVKSMAQLKRPPTVFISASAIGIYGDQGDTLLTESSLSGTKPDFLSQICRDWEEASSLNLPQSIRHVILRIGLVLERNQGMLKQLEGALRTNLAGPLGRGQQWMSWIHIDDLISMLEKAIEDESIRGVYNAVAPNPETNLAVTQSVANYLNCLALIPAPKVALRLALGEFSNALLASQKVYPQRFLDAGFRFQFLKLTDALKAIFKDPSSSRLFYAEQWVPQPIEKVFTFFSDEKNLEQLTPPWLNFKVEKKSTAQIEEGTLIDYSLRIHYLPVRWQSKITSWNSPTQFVDEQTSGPYHRWHHTHTFEEFAGGTLIKDIVLYELPLKQIGDLFAHPFVYKDVQKIFSFRKKTISSLFK